jgi:hypothetical protein
VFEREHLLDRTGGSRRVFAGVADAKQAQQESNFVLRFEGSGGMVHTESIGWNLDFITAAVSPLEAHGTGWEGF